MPSRSKRLLIGNWKMNPARLADARRILAAYKKVAAKLKRTAVVACPPSLYVPLVAVAKKGKGKRGASVSAGAQNVFYESEGAFTGEISAKMLRDIGVSYVIVGHSERRNPPAGGGETDQVVAKKAVAALSAGLTTIVCVGEAVHDADGAYLETLKVQIKGSLDGVPNLSAAKLVIAYEPIWAIGAAEAMKPEDIREVAIYIKKVVSDLFGQEQAMDLPVLYGGSVNWRNAGDIIRVGGVQGLLVGRESVNVPGFVELAKAVDAS